MHQLQKIRRRLVLRRLPVCRCQKMLWKTEGEEVRDSRDMLKSRDGLQAIRPVLGRLALWWRHVVLELAEVVAWTSVSILYKQSCQLGSIIPGGP